MARRNRLSTLQHAVRPRVLLRYGGLLAATVGLLTLVPAAAALAGGEYESAAALGIVGLALSAGGFLCHRIRAPAGIQPNESLVLVAGAFVLTPAAMIWPFTTWGLTPADAWFEAVSAVTTTGLTTLPAPAGEPWPLLLTRSWMQWYGGLGFAALCVALLVPRGIAARRLLEPTGARESDIPSMIWHARRLMMIYAVLTLVGWLALWGAEGRPFVAFVHVLSGVSTGGFSTMDRSLAGFGGSGSAWVLSLITLLAAVSLPLYLRAVRGEWRGLLGDAELRALVLAVLAVGAALSLILAATGLDTSTAVQQGFLLGVSAQTTSGFTPVDPATLPDAAKWTSIVSMALGGSVGSTAGGIKLLRLLIVLQVIQLLVQRMALPPHAVAEARLGGRRVEAGEILHILAVPTMFLIVVVASVIPFLLHGYAPLDALFEVVSATGTVGLSTGITSSDLPGLLKGVLAFDMLAGRMEFIAILVVLAPHTWIGRRYTTR
ncbi:MAG TPA: potassium transporter TrkG [Woeseiaceae bacterium]|nr:potassium transporter TrkG [Woeseiaceae bacterium]